MRHFLFVTLSLILSTSGYAQANRVKQTPPDASTKFASSENETSAEQFYQEADAYSKTKIAEYQSKKVPYSDALYKQTLIEQKQLAAKYAAMLAKRQNLSNEDFYFWGMLHWVAENFDGTIENLDKYLAGENVAPEKAQTARGIKSIIAARRKNFEDAERFLSEYLKNEPIKIRERHKAETELTSAYREAGDFEKAAPHAEEAYRAAKAMFRETSSKVRALADLLEAGTAVFEIYRDSGKQDKTDAVLEDLRKTAALVEATGIYYYAIDNQIKYMIETNRKPEALRFYADSSKQIEKDFSIKPLQEEVERRLERRKVHYKLLNEPAPELVSIDRAIPTSPKSITNLRGKVVMLDFWAIWCGPCIGEFPSLIKWNNTFKEDGLEILGVTRYYGEAGGVKVDEKAEIDFLQRFKTEYNLPYDLMVSKDTTNQITYGATSIPTTVLIDRKGIIRYVDTGTSAGKDEEIQAMIKKLLAEK